MFSSRKWRYGALLVGLVFPGQALSYEVTPEIRQILEQHPAAQELKLRSSAELFDAEAQLGLPDPEASVGINNFPIANPSFDAYLPTNKSIGLKQMFPSTTGREARADAYRHKSGLLVLKSDYVIDQLYGTYLLAAAELQVVEQRQIILAEQRLLFDRFEQSLDALIEAGDTMAFERINALDVQRADLDVRESRLDEMKLSALAQMKAVDAHGALPKTKVAGEGIEKPDAPQVFWAELLSNAGREIATADVAVKSAAYTPDYGVSLTYQQRESGAAFKGDDWVSLKAVIRVPFWSGQIHDNRLSAAKARESAARAKVALSRRDAKEKWEKLLAKHEGALASITRLEQKMQALSKSLEASRNNYESGRGDIASFHVFELQQLNIKDRIIELQLKSVKAIISMHMLVRRQS